MYDDDFDLLSEDQKFLIVLICKRWLGNAEKMIIIIMKRSRVFLNDLLTFCMATTKMVGILTRRHILRELLRKMGTGEMRTPWGIMKATPRRLRRHRWPKRMAMGTMLLRQHQLSRHQMTKRIPCTTTTSSMGDPSKTVLSKFFSFYFPFWLLFCNVLNYYYSRYFTFMFSSWKMNYYYYYL